MYKMKREKQKRDILKSALDRAQFAALQGDLEAVKKIISTSKNEYDQLVETPIKRKRVTS